MNQAMPPLFIPPYGNAASTTTNSSSTDSTTNSTGASSTGSSTDTTSTSNQSTNQPNDAFNQFMARMVSEEIYKNSLNGGRLIINIWLFFGKFN